MSNCKSFYVIFSLFLCFQVPVTHAAIDSNTNPNNKVVSKIQLSPQQLVRLRIARSAVKETLRGDFNRFGYDAQTFKSHSEAEKLVVFFETIAYTYSNYIEKRRLNFEQKMEVTRLILRLASGGSAQNIGRSIRLDYLKAAEINEIIAIYKTGKQVK